MHSMRVYPGNYWLSVTMTPANEEMRGLKMLRILLTSILCATCVAATMAEDVAVKVYVNGELQQYDPPALVRDGKTYVPLRQGAESIGCSVKWIPEQSVAQICTASTCVLIPKDKGIIVQGRLLLPLRLMGEAIGAKVQWDSDARAVRIEKKPTRPRFD